MTRGGDFDSKFRPLSKKEVREVMKSISKDQEVEEKRRAADGEPPPLAPTTLTTHSVE